MHCSEKCISLQRPVFAPPALPADHLKRLFDEPPGPHPPAFLGELPISARRMLACGRCDAPGRMPELVPAHSQKGRALVHACQLSEGRPLAAVPPLLQRCSRLLSVEEGCLEQDICRWGGTAFAPFT